MILELKRYKLTENTTIGRLYVDGVFQCYTLEDRYRPGQAKVPGETCIPCGDYQCEVTFSPKFGVLMPLIKNVLNFLGIRIHWGNTKVDTLGCVLVGNTVAVDFVGESRAAYKALMEILPPPGTEFTLRISIA